MAATNMLIALVALLAALGGGLYQVHFKSLVDAYGLLGRVIEPRNNVDCEQIPELTACEKIVLHQPSGNIFAACSTAESRIAWTPATQRLNASARSTTDFIGIYDPAKDTLRKFKLSGFNDPRGLNVHGLDVVPSAANPAELFVYAVNQRPPLDGINSEKVAGPHSSVEVFKLAALTASTLEHIATVDAPVMRSPNDVVGGADGTHFWFTNDGSHHRGFALQAQTWLKTSGGSIGVCKQEESSVNTGANWACKIAADHLPAANGIARNGDTFFVANHFLPEIRALELQADGSLVVTEIIKTVYPADNLVVDKEGGLWSAVMPKAADRNFGHFGNVSIPSPSSAYRMTLNTGRSAFFGEKYNHYKVFEDDGTLASGMTTALYDLQRGRLFLSGLMTPTVLCDVRPSKVKPMEDWSQ